MTHRPLRRRQLWVILATITSLIALFNLFRLWSDNPPDRTPSSAQAQLEWLNKQLIKGADVSANEHYGSGLFLMNAFYGLSWTQVARANSSDATLRSTAIAQASYCLSRMTSPVGTAHFFEAMNPRFGIAYQGWTNWLRGSILALQSPAQRNKRMLADQAAADAAIVNAVRPSVFAMSMPGGAWPADTAVAMASLALSDRVAGRPVHRLVLDAWVGQLQKHLDTTGLPAYEIDPLSKIATAGPQGLSSALLIRFVAEINSTVAAKLYRAWSDQFLADPWGLGPAVRQYPQGLSGGSTVDSGPLIFGVSAPASVAGLALARVMGDTSLANALYGEGELTGAALRLPGSKRYALGMSPLGNAMLVWAQTAVPVTHGLPVAGQAAKADIPGVGRWGWTWWILLVPLLLWTVAGSGWLRRNRGRLPGVVPEFLRPMFGRNQDYDTHSLQDDFGFADDPDPRYEDLSRR